MALIGYSSVIYEAYSGFNDQFDNFFILNHLKRADQYLETALAVFRDIQTYIAKPSLLGFKYEPQHIPDDERFEPLNVPMICLNVIDEFKSLISPQHTLYKENIGIFRIYFSVGDML